MSLDSLVERDCTPVSPDMEMGRLIHVISRSRTNYIPVCDEDKRLLGEVDITKLRHIIFRTELYHRFTVRQLMSPPAQTLHINDPMEDVMQLFQKTGAYVLPVVDTDQRLLGFITRSRVYTVYRQMVADMSED